MDRVAVRVRRVYEPPEPSDGQRVLVDRLWPRGLPKAAAQLDAWLRDVAPSSALRTWYAHDPERWPEFERRYRAELEEPPRRELVEDLARRARSGPLTLLCAARDPERSNAAVLQSVIRARLGST